jgi:hypothetical protein
MAFLTNFEIPLSPRNQQFRIVLAGVPYVLRFLFNQTLDENACWILDILDVNENPIVCGLPVVTGEDMLVQYKYLGMNIVIFCFTDGDPSAVPTAVNLGVSSHVYFEELV